MFRTLGRVGVRLGMAAGLVLIVAGILAVARLGSTSRGDVGLIDDHSPQVTAAVDPTAGDDGEVLPTPSDANDAAIRGVAADFVAAWLRRDLSATNWQAGLAPLSTRTLLASLDGVDPTTVPAARIVGGPQLILRSERYAQVSIPVDTGTLLLDLLSTDGRWLVDAVDWDRS